MPYEMREGQGTLWRNKHKREGDNKPGLTGTILINGKVYEISAWKKQPNPDKPPFFSVSVKPKDEQQRRPRQEKQDQQRNFDDDWV